MFDKELKELEAISQAVGNFPDMVQGGGGNTSVKLDGELMAVKASGFKLSQINSVNGFVAVNYRNIKNYYENVDLALDTDFEKESVEFVKKNIVELEGIKSLRPSVEAGFHSIMKKYVIHTHPVYANILCCSHEGRELMERIFAKKPYECIWIPYINPGFCLTLKIKDEIDRCMKEKGKFPEVIFLENHGLVVTCDEFEKSMSLHGEVNDLIIAHLGIKDKFPAIELEKKNETLCISRNSYLSEFFRGRNIGPEFFDEIALYPDQLVYLNGNISINGSGKKLNINTKTGEITYETGFAEALTMEETLMGYVYVVAQIEKNKLHIKTMTPKEADFIKNWESESYRKSLVKELTR